jgi:ATP-binding cassette subfamily F protein 3
MSMYFMRCDRTRVFEIDHGEMLIYNGNYEYYLEKAGMEHRAA